MTRTGRVVALPLALYWGMTLVVPWLRGAGADPAFAGHAFTVVVTSLLAARLAKSLFVR